MPTSSQNSQQQPLTPEREQEIRKVHDLLGYADKLIADPARQCIGELLAEIDRLREEQLEILGRSDKRRKEAADLRAELAARPTRAEVLRTERSRWVALADALNAAGVVGIDLDGTITDHNAWSVIWDRNTQQWAVAGYDAEAGESR